MCMELDRELTVEIVFGETSTRTFYKLTNLHRESPFGCYHSSLTYNKGEVVVSDRSKSFLTDLEILSTAVYHGIHLCCDLKEAQEAADYILVKYTTTCQIIPVSVHRDHFIGAGSWTERPECSCIVATQCTVLE